MAFENLAAQEREAHLAVEACPFKIGSRVLVRQGDASKSWASDWANETFIVTGLRWNYMKADGSKIDIELAGPADILHRNGSTSGFGVGDLELFDDASTGVSA